MLKIQGCYADEMTEPKIEVTDNAFKITLPNVNFAPAIFISLFLMPMDVLYDIIYRRLGYEIIIVFVKGW